jgi:hypothetical protein
MTNWFENKMKKFFSQGGIKVLLVVNEKLRIVVIFKKLSELVINTGFNLL